MTWTSDNVPEVLFFSAAPDLTEWGSLSQMQAPIAVGATTLFYSPALSLDQRPSQSHRAPRTSVRDRAQIPDKCGSLWPGEGNQPEPLLGPAVLAFPFPAKLRSSFSARCLMQPRPWLQAQSPGLPLLPGCVGDEPSGCCGGWRGCGDSGGPWASS